MSHDAIPMTEGPLVKNIIRFAIPIALTGMLQQLFNSADTAVVGRFADARALAAVGINGELIALFICLSAGLSIGSNVLIASYIGNKKLSAIGKAVHTSIALSLLLGIAGMVIGLLIAEPLLALIDTPEDIFPLASLYLKLYFLGYPFLLLYDFAAAILRSRGDSRGPFLSLLFSGAVNVILNLLLVLGFHMSVAGVAIATDVASAVAAFLTLYKLSKAEAPFRFSLSALAIDKAMAGLILRIGVPAALQGAVFCFANIFVQAAINRFGTAVVAGNTIAINYEYFMYYLIGAFGQTATTFTSQNFGAGNLSRCKKVWQHALWLSFASGTIVALSALDYPHAAGLFTTDDAVIEAAGVRFLMIVLWEPFCALFEITACTMRGLGHSTLPALWTIFGVCCLRILWLLLLFPYFPQVETIYLIFPLSWIVTAILMNGSFYRIWRKIGDKG